MFDTATLGIRLEKPLPFNRFGAIQERTDLKTGEVHRKLWLNSEDEEHTWPRIGYYPDSDYLFAEASLPKMLFGNNVKMLYQDDLPEVFRAWGGYCQDALDVRLPTPKTWNVVRIDYACNWQVGDDVSAYLDALSQLNLSHHKRSFQQEHEGVNWKSKSNELKFYNKALESHLPEAEGVLRGELSNFTSGTRYLATKHDVPRTAEHLVTDEMATGTLGSFMERLGLQQDKPILSERGLIEYLSEHFGQRRAPALFWFLSLYQKYGKGFYKYGLMKKPTYYYQFKQVRDAGLLCSVEGKQLEPLTLPGIA